MSYNHSSALKNVMEERGISVRHLAELTGVSERTIWSIRSGKSSGTVDTMQKLASALHVSLAEVCDG